MTVEDVNVVVVVLVVVQEKTTWKTRRADNYDATFWAGLTKLSPCSKVRENCCVQMRVRYGVLFTHPCRARGDRYLAWAKAEKKRVPVLPPVPPMRGGC